MTYDIFTPARVASLTEPFHAKDRNNLTRCGLSLDTALVKANSQVKTARLDWDGTPFVTCTDCDPDYEGEWRRGGRDTK